MNRRHIAECCTVLSKGIRAALWVAMAFGTVEAQVPEGLNNLWMGGYDYDGDWPEPWGGVDLQFFGVNRVVSAVDREIDFSRTNTNITDPAGSLLFSTNGAYLANATGVQMQGGGD